jgi:hypothetical protein
LVDFGVDIVVPMKVVKRIERLAFVNLARKAKIKNRIIPDLRQLDFIQVKECSVQRLLLIDLVQWLL